MRLSGRHLEAGARRAAGAMGFDARERRLVAVLASGCGRRQHGCGSCVIAKVWNMVCDSEVSKNTQEHACIDLGLQYYVQISESAHKCSSCFEFLLNFLSSLVLHDSVSSWSYLRMGLSMMAYRPSVVFKHSFTVSRMYRCVFNVSSRSHFFIANLWGVLRCFLLFLLFLLSFMRRSQCAVNQVSTQNQIISNSIN